VRTTTFAGIGPPEATQALCTAIIIIAACITCKGASDITRVVQRVRRFRSEIVPRIPDFSCMSAADTKPKTGLLPPRNSGVRLVFGAKSMWVSVKNRI